MNISIVKITDDAEEELILRCHEPGSEWVKSVCDAAYGKRSVCGSKDGNLYRIMLTDIYYFEVVDNSSFIYTKNEVFESREKLYEFETICSRSSLFRCSKSMILNADKIDYVRPSLSGRFEAVLSNGEMIIVSRKYVSELKHLLGI